MTVIDHEPGGWCLVADGERLLLDVTCHHSAASYLFLMELNDAERTAYSAHGHDLLSQLAEQIHYSAPGVIGNGPPYGGRNLRGEDRARVDEAKTAWGKEHYGAL
jgi:hypothetical protein